MTIDAEDLFVRHFLGILTPEQKDATARWIRSKQREDGSWATFYAGPADLSTTVEAYVALRLAGDPADAAHMRTAAELVRDAGGVERTRVFTRMWLSLLALWSWEEVPALPPEQILLPPRAPLSIYSFGCWARQTIVALSIASALRPSDDGAVRDRRAAHRRRAARCRSSRGPAVHVRSTAGCTATSGSRSAALRRRALRAAEQLDRRAPGGGRLVGRHPAAVGLVDRRAARARLSARPPRDRARARRPRQLHDRGRAGPPARGVPVAGLGHRAARARAARRRASTPATTPSRAARAGSPAARCACAATGPCGGRTSRAGRLPVRVRERQLSRRRRHGRRRARARGARAIDDARARPSAASPGRSACSRATAAGRAFDVDNTSGLPAKLPFCDFGAVTDPPSADVTAHMVEMLALRGTRATRTRRSAASTGCCASRSPTARGSAAGARTTSTAPAPSSRRSPRAASPAIRASAPPSPGSSACRTTTAASARTSARTATAAGAGAASRPRRRPPGRCSPPRGRRATGPRSSARCAGSSRRSAPTAAGTSRTSPAPASRATSTSTTTSTGRSSR